MEISKEELSFLLKSARNTGFIAAFVACFCVLILGGLFAFYIYKSYGAEMMQTTQTQEISDNVNNANGVITNENKTNTNN